MFRREFARLFKMLNEEISEFKELIELGEMPKADWLLIDEFEVDYDTDEDENTLLSSDIKTELSLKDRLINLVSTGD